MPQDGLFFRVLRRFNIIWVALLGVLLIVGFGYHCWKNPMLRHELLGKPVASTVSLGVLPTAAQEVLDPESFGSETSYYGPDENTVMVLNKYNAVPTAPEDYANYVPKQAINVMVLDQKTGGGQWLFPGKKQIVVSRDALYEGAATTKTVPATDLRPAIGMTLGVIDADTDKDGALTTKDTPSLYVWTKGMPAAKKLMVMDEMISVGQYGADRYIVVYRKGKELRTVTYTIPEFTVVADKPLPATPK